MSSIAGMAVATCSGDLAGTFAALISGNARPGRLNGAFTERLIALGKEALNGRAADLIIFSTTKADLEIWCEDLLAKQSTGRGGPADVARALGHVFNARSFAISAACASGTVALGVAARTLALGHAQRVLLIGGDRLGPFVSAGFAALRAIDPNGCHPFDADRAGLALGETAAAIVLDRSSSDFYVSGWGSSMDANHLTGPSRTGDGLTRACSAALRRAGLNTPALIVAHGTGTKYNDDAESMAYATVCPNTPVVGFKGGLGHSLGACGLTEFALAVEALKNHQTPGTVGLKNRGCAGTISVLPPGKHAIAEGAVLTANAGFGGLNGVAIVATTPPRPLESSTTELSARIEFDHRGWRKQNEHGTWREPANTNELPMLSAREILGRIDATWGRMDLSCRLLVALGVLIGPLPEETAVIVLSERGCAATDRVYEQLRRTSGADPQLFPYTLPSTPVGEVSIRLTLRGAGFAALGATDDEGRRMAQELLADSAPAVLLARVEADRAPHTAWAELWSTRKS